MPRSRQMKLGPPIDLLVQRAVMLLLDNAPEDGSPYYGCFSGGKDSVAIKKLTHMAWMENRKLAMLEGRLVPRTRLLSPPERPFVIWHYNVIIDPPELMRFIMSEHPDVKWERAKKKNGEKRSPFFRRIREKLMVPTRFRRWCCNEYKHTKGPKGCTRILGIRIEESAKRKSRYTACVMPKAAGRQEIYPIRLWTHDNVWQFIRGWKIPYCSLYDEGFERLGCVGCPLGTPKHRMAEFARWPKFEQQWRAACDFVVAERTRLGKPPPPAIFAPSGQPRDCRAPPLQRGASNGG